MMTHLRNVFLRISIAVIVVMYLSGCVPLTPIPTGDDSVIQSSTSLSQTGTLTGTLTGTVDKQVEEAQKLTPEPTISEVNGPQFEGSESSIAEPTQVTTSMGRIEGRAFWKPSGEAVHGLEIALNSEDESKGRNDLKTLTDEEGSYLLDELNPDVYNISLAWNLTESSTAQCDGLFIDSGLDGSWLSMVGENPEGDKILIAVSAGIAIEPAETLQLNFEFECR